MARFGIKLISQYFSCDTSKFESDYLFKFIFSLTHFIYTQKLTLRYIVRPNSFIYEYFSLTEDTERVCSLQLQSLRLFDRRKANPEIFYF